MGSADNFRDIGGPLTGYPTTDGRHVARGVVYRSNALTLTGDDAATVEKLGVREIIDLRTTSEIASKPDVAIAGAHRVNYDVLGDVAHTPELSTPEQSTAFMAGTYRQFVTSSTARKAIAATLTAIAKERGATIVHCTAGKDRTGWTTALLLHIAGVSQDLINQDYLLSNQYSRASTNATLAGITAQSGQSAAAAYAPLLGVQQSFLDAGYAQVEQDYGSLDDYITTGLRLSAGTISALKSKLTD